jgi:hypothetical protein
VATALYTYVVLLSQPFVSTYNSLVHLFNESFFFAYLCTCVTFTDFMDDIPTRKLTASILFNLMYVIIAVNVIACLVGVYLSSMHRFCKQTKKAVLHPFEQEALSERQAL